jgi:peptidoglycan/LPS O-acetylase OafA/YrhL
VLATVLFLPIDLKGFAESLLASLGFVANIYFWRTTNYFAQLANERPLLHLWSLGVEEQFYILFPLLVLVFAKRRPSFLLPLVSVLVGLSLLANIVAMRSGASSPAFYLLPTRAWELGAGCILALAPTASVPKRIFRQVLELFAVAFLVIGLFFNGLPFWKSSTPSAIWVVVGASILIYFGDAESSWITRALSHRACVWVGLISYSLYLWHWPILVVSRYYFVRENFPAYVSALLLVLMFLCATLSWQYVERPFRNRSMPIRTVCTYVGSVAACLLVVAAVLVGAQGLPSRFNPSIAKINAMVGSEFRCGLQQTFPFGGYRACMIGTSGVSPATATVAVVGNSHAQMYAPLIADILKQTHQGAVLAHMNSCMPMPDLNLSDNCLEQAAKNLTAVEALPRVRVVILATTWFLDLPLYTHSGVVPRDEASSVFSSSLDRLIERLQREGKSVVLVGPLAVPGYDSASVVGRKMAYGHPVTEPLFRPETEYRAEYGNILSHFSSRRDIVFIRPDQIQCANGKCDFFRDGVPLFADDTHLAQASLYLFRPEFESAILPTLQ